LCEVGKFEGTEFVVKVVIAFPRYGKPFEARWKNGGVGKL
jgi:hypothetical protein